MINCTITGKVRQLSELKQGKKGQFLTFAIPENRYHKGKSTTTWHDFIAFGKLAQRLADFAKDDTVVSLQFRIDYDKADNNPRKYARLIVMNADLIEHYGRHDGDGA